MPSDSSGAGRPVRVSRDWPVAMADVDRVYIFYGTYFRWADAGTSALLGALGRPLSGLLDSGYGFPAVATKAEFLSPVGLDDEARVVSWFADVGRTSLSSVHDVTELSSRRAVARVEIRHVTTFNGRPIVVPDWLRAGAAGEPARQATRL